MHGRNMLPPLSSFYPSSPTSYTSLQIPSSTLKFPKRSLQYPSANELLCSSSVDSGTRLNSSPPMILPRNEPLPALGSFSFVNSTFSSPNVQQEATDLGEGPNKRRKIEWCEWVEGVMEKIQANIQELQTRNLMISEKNSLLRAEVQLLSSQVDKAFHISPGSSATPQQSLSLSPINDFEINKRSETAKILELEIEGLFPEYHKASTTSDLTFKLAYTGNIENENRQASNESPPWKKKSKENWTVGIIMHDNFNNPFTQAQISSILGEETVCELSPVEGDPNSLQGVLKNLKFHEVSSNYGGYFIIEPRLLQPRRYANSVSSLQYRVKVQTKPRKEVKDPQECELDDPLTVIKGFGPTYATKFAEIGYQTVRDILNFPLPDADNLESGIEFKKCLEKVRKPRGKSEHEFECLIREIQTHAKEKLIQAKKPTN